MILIDHLETVYKEWRDTRGRSKVPDSPALDLYPTLFDTRKFFRSTPARRSLIFRRLIPEFFVPTAWSKPNFGLRNRFSFLFLSLPCLFSYPFLALLSFSNSSPLGPLPPPRDSKPTRPLCRLILGFFGLLEPFPSGNSPPPSKPC